MRIDLVKGSLPGFLVFVACSMKFTQNSVKNWEQGMCVCGQYAKTYHFFLGTRKGLIVSAFFLLLFKKTILRLTKIPKMLIVF